MGSRIPSFFPSPFTSLRRAGRARHHARQFSIEENPMDMTDLQRRWWFANHPEFSWDRTRSRLLGRRSGEAGLSANSNTALANERLRKENFIQKMMARRLEPDQRPKSTGNYLMTAPSACPRRGFGLVDNLTIRSGCERASAQNSLVSLPLVADQVDGRQDYLQWERPNVLESKQLEDVVRRRRSEKNLGI